MLKFIKVYTSFGKVTIFVGKIRYERVDFIGSVDLWYREGLISD